MHEASCQHCGKLLGAFPGMAFCPFCGGPLSGEGQANREPEKVLAIVRQLEETADPRKKHELLLRAEAEYPQSLAVAQELLFLGRLYERGGKGVDFSVIKCHLLMLYLDPGQFSAARRAEMREELFAHPQLLKCLSLSEDEDAFLRMYLIRLAGEFIRLFLRGDSRYMRRIFGLGMESRAPKLLADPVAAMIVNAVKDENLSARQQDMLARTLYQAFSKDMAGETQWMNGNLQKAGINLSNIM